MAEMPAQIRSGLAAESAVVVDAQLLVTLRHGIAAEDIDVEVHDQLAQQRLALADPSG
jgi:hypothetical protein